jgi:hypothetical protein
LTEETSSGTITPARDECCRIGETMAVSTLRTGVKKLTSRSGWLAAAGLILIHAAAAQSTYPPLARNTWTQVAPEGFGDRQNSWAWSMAWFQGKLLVGTNRANACVVREGQSLKNPSLPYPPGDPNIKCAANPDDLPLQAEIWSWDPSTNMWTRVFQSPNDIPIPNTSPQLNTAPDIGFRNMFIFTEQSGTQALYVSGCSAESIYPGVPGARILRSVDGVNFLPLSQTPGTVLGDLGSQCFRGAASYNGKLYLIASAPWSLLEATNPEQGDNAFQIVTKSTAQPEEVGVFNGYLYVAFASNEVGFTVAKTQATGSIPYKMTPIITNGGYKSPWPNKSILSMAVFNGNLYVGGDGLHHSADFNGQGAELFAIYADDSWDVVVGATRTLPDGSTKSPLSGLGVGFGWNYNNHMWRQEVFDGRLYVGTFDESTTLRFDNPTVLGPQEGFDLYYTDDGITFTPVDINGFEDKFNDGVRSLITTPYGLFLGSANQWFGLEIWQGIPPGFVAPAP